MSAVLEDLITVIEYFFGASPRILSAFRRTFQLADVIAIAAPVTGVVCLFVGAIATEQRNAIRRGTAKPMSREERRLFAVVGGLFVIIGLAGAGPALREGLEIEYVLVALLVGRLMQASGAAAAGARTRRHPVAGTIIIAVALAIATWLKTRDLDLAVGLALCAVSSFFAVQAAMSATRMRDEWSMKGFSLIALSGTLFEPVLIERALGSGWVANAASFLSENLFLLFFVGGYWTAHVSLHAKRASPLPTRPPRAHQ